MHQGDGARPSVTYSPEFVKQVRKLGDHRGWHRLDDVGVNVASHAKSTEGQSPVSAQRNIRFGPPFAVWSCPQAKYSGEGRLEKDVAYTELANQHGLLSERAAVLVTLFSRRPGSS